MTVVVGPAEELPPENATETQLTTWGDSLAAKLGWTKFAASTSLNPYSGFPQRMYIKGKQLLFVEYLGWGKQPSRQQLTWLNNLSEVAQASQDAVVMQIVNNRDSAKTLAKVLESAA